MISMNVDILSEALEKLAISIFVSTQYITIKKLIILFVRIALLKYHHRASKS